MKGGIEKAKLACKNSDINVFEHFVGADKLSKRAKNGGTMPEDLPTPKKSLKQLEKESSKSLRKK